MKPRLTSVRPAFVSRSTETGSRYRIYVDTPDAARSPGPWPAVFLMDGDFLFDFAVDAAASLVKEGKIPPCALIGVGYGVPFGKPGNFRGRDYTPTASPMEAMSGGAERFLHYLTHTLWPEVSLRYRLRRTGRVIAGHSIGSLFTLYALFQHRPFFNRALASAPSIWWDDRSILRHAESLRDRTSNLDGRLYLGVGANDTPSMTADMDLLNHFLSDRPFTGLQTRFDRFPGHDHYDVIPKTLRAGLTALLA